MKYTFEAYKEDGSPRKWAGTFRPPYDEANKEYLEVNRIAMYGLPMEFYFNGAYDKQLYEDEDD